MIRSKDDDQAPVGPADVADDEGFLERWSRRKAEAMEAPTESAAPSVSETDAGDDVEAQPAPVLTDEDMPPLEDLGEDSDYSGFLSSGVSEQLRSQALKKLFRSAKFNVCDGLDDYAEDYTKFEPLGDIITADMKFEMEQAAKRALEAAAEDEAPEKVALAEDAAAAPDDDGEERPPEDHENGEGGFDDRDRSKDDDDARLG